MASVWKQELCSVPRPRACMAGSGPHSATRSRSLGPGAERPGAATGERRSTPRTEGPGPDGRSPGRRGPGTETGATADRRREVHRANGWRDQIPFLALPHPSVPHCVGGKKNRLDQCVSTMGSCVLWEPEVGTELQPHWAQWPVAEAPECGCSREASCLSSGPPWCPTRGAEPAGRGHPLSCTELGTPGGFCVIWQDNKWPQEEWTPASGPREGGPHAQGSGRAISLAWPHVPPPTSQSTCLPFQFSPHGGFFLPNSEETGFWAGVLVCF